jgi:very-short-patch-repair endonuclease
MGLGRGAIDRRVRSGRLSIVHRGVFAVGYPRADALALAKAAELAGGPGTILSHSSAAYLWGVTKRWWTPPEITVTRDRRRSTLRVHVSRTITRRDIRTQCGIRVTSPARTLLDNAPRLDDDALVRAVNDLRHRRHLRLDDLAELLCRLPHAPGADRLLSFVQNDHGITRSVFEDAFRKFVRQFDLPMPEFNFPVAGRVADAYFPEHRLIVELDSLDFHSDPQAFENDRDRDVTALAVGIPTVRITWTRLIGRSEREGRLLRTILARQRPSAD